MTSIFLTEKKRRGPLITFLLLEAYQVAQEEVTEPVVTAEQQLDLLRAAFVTAFGDAPVEIVRGAFARLVEKAAAPAKEQKPDADEERKMGKTIAEYLESLSPEEICFLAADFDVSEARRLYCEEDFETVQHLSRVRTRWEMVKYFSHQEAVNIGFAGTGDDDGNAPAKRTGSAGAIKVADASASALNDRLGFLRGTTRH